MLLAAIGWRASPIAPLRRNAMIQTKTWEILLSAIHDLISQISDPRLRDAGLLAQKGRGSATYYVPTERLATDEAGLSGNPPDLSTNPDGLSTNPPALSTNPEDLYAKHTEEEENRRKALLDEIAWCSRCKNRCHRTTEPSGRGVRCDRGHLPPARLAGR